MGNCVTGAAAGGVCECVCVFGNEDRSWSLGEEWAGGQNVEQF